jgi:hypothetical protein
LKSIKSCLWPLGLVSPISAYSGAAAGFEQRSIALAVE